MKRIYVNLKRFDVPVELGGVNRLASPQCWASTIMEGGFGRISYVVRDNTYGAPARHMEGSRVPQGAHVMIYEIKDNVFYVTELNI